MTSPKIYILHENPEWVEPLQKALDSKGLPYTEWILNEGKIDLEATPPEGIFYNRMSASAHTRGNRYAAELTSPVLAWLAAHNRKVINGHRALQLEVRKMEQYIALKQANISVPKTFATVGRKSILEAADYFLPAPFIIKPNRGGKGVGVQLIQTKTALESFLKNMPDDYSLDGLILVQEYIRPKASFITRMEFIGGKFYYAVKVDTSDGFELCPADACEIGDDFCPTTPEEAAKPKFEIIPDFYIPEIEKIEKFLADNDILVAGLEFVENIKGERFFYDINTNTNYNSSAEARSQQYNGMKHLANFLESNLTESYAKTLG